MGLPLIVGDRGRIPVQGPAKRRSSGPGRQKLPNEFNKLRKFLPPRPASLAKSVLPLQERASGEMAEWLKAHAWKACVRETVPWVRIPLSPPFLRYSSFQYPIVRIHREITEEPCDVALILRESCSFFAVGSEDRFREREYMAVLAQTVRLALDFERIVVAGLATSGSLHHRDVYLSEMRAARRVGPLLHGRLFRRLLAAQAEAANPRQRIPQIQSASNRPR
jgi:hypothetical protein